MRVGQGFDGSLGIRVVEYISTFEASSIFPAPRYIAIFGQAHRGRVRITLLFGSSSSLSLKAIIRSGDTPPSTQRRNSAPMLLSGSVGPFVRGCPKLFGPGPKRQCPIPGQAIEDLRQKEASLRRAAARRASPADIGLPGESAYREAVSDLNGALEGSNVEAARAALGASSAVSPCSRTAVSWPLG